MSPEHFHVLHQDMLAHVDGKDLFVQDPIGGADADNALPTRVVTEFAWHSLFIRNLLIRPERAALEGFLPKLTIIDLPSFRADPASHGCRTETVIACDLTNGIVLIGQLLQLPSSSKVTTLFSSIAKTRTSPPSASK